MAKEMKHDSVTARFLTERDAKELLSLLIAILDNMFPGFFEKGLNEVAPRADGEEHTARYTKPA